LDVTSDVLGGVIPAVVIHTALVVFFAFACRFLVIETTGLERPEIESAAVGLGITIVVGLAVFIYTSTLALFLLIADVRATLRRLIARAAREQLLTHANDFFAAGLLSLFFNR